jgi:hypothetical protein
VSSASPKAELAGSSTHRPPRRAGQKRVLPHADRRARWQVRGRSRRCPRHRSTCRASARPTRASVAVGSAYRRLGAIKTDSHGVVMCFRAGLVAIGEAGVAYRPRDFSAGTRVRAGRGLLFGLECFVRLFARAGVRMPFQFPLAGAAARRVAGEILVRSRRFLAR